MGTKATRAYRENLCEHNAAVLEALSKVSPETRAFMQQHFRVDLYPIEWVREFSQSLEALRSGKQE